MAESLEMQRAEGPQAKVPANTIMNILQFKIVLRDIKPKIWRRIQVPSSYTFREFHVAIQKVMGWQSVFADYHSHEFSIVNPETRTKETIGSKDASIDSSCWSAFQNFARIVNHSESVDEYKQQIGTYFIEPVVDRALYTYDFGDKWRHVIRFERIFKAEPGETYPKCTGGGRACPPEDCGGASGYEQLLEALADPKHSNHDELVEWVKSASPGFKADFFDPSIPFVRPYDIILEFMISVQNEGPKLGWYDLQVPDYFTMHKLHVAIKKILGLKHTKNAQFKLHEMSGAEVVLKAKNKENSPKVYEVFSFLPQKAYYQLEDGKAHKIILVESYVPQHGKKYPNCEGGIKVGPIEDCDCGKKKPEDISALEILSRMQVPKFPKPLTDDAKEQKGKRVVMGDSMGLF